MDPKLWEIYSNWDLRVAYKREFFRGLGHDPHGGQELIHFEPWRFHVGVWGRRGGKSQGAANEVIEEASWPGSRIWIAAPTYLLTDKVFRIVYQEIVQNECLGPGTVLKASYDPKGQRFIHLAGGGFIEGKTCENPKSLLGEGLDLLILDEAAQVNLDVWDTYLEPTLVDRKGRALFITTPRGYNWIYDLWMEGSSKLGQEAGWARSHIKTADNPYIDADDLEDKRRRTDPATFRQEYEASFEAKKGVVYSDFSDTYTHKGGHCFNSSDVDHESYIRISDQWTHYRAIDPGLANPTAVVWAAVDPKGNVYVYDEYSLSGALVKEHAMNIAAKTHDPVLTSFIDPKAAARNDETGHTTQENYAKYGIYTTPAVNDIPYGIQKVAEYLRAAKEDTPVSPAVYIAYDKCPELRKHLVQYEWDENRSVTIAQNDPDRPRKYNDHLPDALRYLLAMSPRYVNPKLLRQDELEVPDEEPNEARWDGGPSAGV
jgi:hypothetical protein